MRVHDWFFVSYSSNQELSLNHHTSRKNGAEEDSIHKTCKKTERISQEEDTLHELGKPSHTHEMHESSIKHVLYNSTNN